MLLGRKDLNLKIKYRESFRPFAAAVLAEDVVWSTISARRHTPNPLKWDRLKHGYRRAAGVVQGSRNVRPVAGSRLVDVYYSDPKPERARAGQARSGAIAGSMQRLQFARGTLIGTVLTKYDHRIAGYGYGYGHSYGAGYNYSYGSAHSYGRPVGTDKAAAPAVSSTSGAASG